jgi:alpha-tubulin suppressor-like RCC1 family protein
LADGTVISFLDQLINSGSTTLSAENYSAVKDKYSYFSARKRNQIHELAVSYDKWLTARGLSDTNQLAAELIKQGTKRKYDLIMIDEAQDYTELQLYMLMKLAKSERRVIFCGDINQNVRPTFFMFERLYNLYYAFGCTNAKDNLFTLTKNYRSCKEIVLLLNRILDEQGRRIGFQGAKEDEGIFETGFRDGSTPLVLGSTSETLNRIMSAIYDKHYAIAVVADEQARAAIVGSFPASAGRIFTVQEAKGLEYDTVFAANITSAYEKEWAKILIGSDVKRVRKYRQFFGYIYVAASRARNHLVILEEDGCPFLNMIDGTYEPLKIWDLAKLGLARRSTADDFDRDARKLEKAGLSDKAGAARKTAQKLREQTGPEQETVSAAPPKRLESAALPASVVYLAKKLILMENSGKKGVQNELGDIIIECKYDSISHSEHRDKNGKSVFECCLDGEMTYIDRNGNVYKSETYKPPKKMIKRNIVVTTVTAFTAIYIVLNTVSAILFEKNFQTKPDFEYITKPPEPISDFIQGNMIQVSAGDTHSAALTEDGTVWTWGDNLYEGDSIRYTGSAIVTNYTDESVNPANKKIAIDDVAYVTTGRYVTAAIKKDGTLWTWGFNGFGALGNGIDYETPDTIFTVDSTPYKILDDVKSVSLGDNWGMAVKSDGTLWTWGSNNYGELGNGADKKSCIPVKVMEGISAVSAGGYHGLALKTDGTVWVWGSNQYGQLGYVDNTVEFASKPRKVMENASRISAGYVNSSVIKNDGTFWTWGENTWDGQKTEIMQLPIGNLDNVVQIEDGCKTTLILYNNGTLYAFSGKEYALVELMTSVVQVSIFSYHFLAIQKDGSVWAWGYNEKCQLGDGTMQDRDSPVMIYQNE